MTEMAQRFVGALRIAAVLGLLAAAESAAGQAGVWSSNGPAGGNVHCLVFDPLQPSTVYAGTDQGVFKSDDGGSSWTASSAGLPADRVQTIAVDPADPAILYAGTLTPAGVQSVGIFKSTDGGASWAPINAGLIDPVTLFSPVDIEALAVDPAHPDTLLAGSRFSEIFKSTDAGANWEPKTLGGFNVALETSAFLFDPSASSTVYAASTQGLVRSTDGGESWAFYGDANISFYALAIDPTSVTTLYAGNVTGFGVLKSTDGGAHWSQTNNGLPVNQGSSGQNWPFVDSIVVDPSHPATLYAGTYGNGLFQSTNGGATWAPAGNGIRSPFVTTLAWPGGQSTTLYAGTFGGGVYQSHDAAHTWTPTNAGLNLSLVTDVVTDPTMSNTLYASAFDGVYRSTDGGASWQRAVTGFPPDPVAALAFAPGALETLFAGTLGGGLLWTSDGGTTWSSGAPGLTDSYVSSVAVDPSSPSTLYAGTAHPDTSVSERVFKSVDGGGSWAQTSLDAKALTIDFLAVDPANPSRVVAVSRGAASYFQSLDAGQSWSSLSPDSSCGGVNAIFFDASGKTTYLAGTAGVCRSTDGGHSWTLSPVASLASVQTLLLDPGSSSRLYAGASPAAAGGTGGVFRSIDGGQTWEPVGSGLSAASVNSLAIDAEGKTLHAGIRGGGVAELSLAPERLPIELPSPGGRRTRVLDSR